ncbi:M24 family metallopeptidase [Fervidobacterium nodosum]|uniref:Peptidase M24 n=1 Tax=Fervidobacterium nodosum (strain ATCC 35602 / DSM 5306 / Rt17-B1) TaxID=381764 RepID=A7HJW6_FERNB|nr:Xaa-Pro peptidase family protein [Fervidobacterium nodosum]ABS60199.1 peptidase M24 [Fervidobacterium nodosum Rt17-B1]
MNTRLEEVKAKIFEKNVDAILVLNVESSNTVTTRYLSGFTGSFSALLITPKRHLIVTDSRYWTQVKEESTFELVKYIPPKTFLDTIAELINSMELQKLAIEKDRISAGYFEDLREKLKIEFEDVSSLLLEVRSRKTEEEIEKIKVAVEIAQEAFKKMLEIAKPGMKEYELAAYLEYQMKLFGADDRAFDTIIASGYRGALPHGKASEKVIEKGEAIVVDWGARYKGYNSDLTRVFSIGEPSDKVKEVHKIVYDAQQKALDSIKAGITGKEVDSIARNHIAESGYGEYFGHGLGHGLGLEVHENPSLSYRNEKPLEDGHIVTVEPGIYLEGEFGIRIEEDVVVRENGCEILSTLPREIIII